MKKEILCWCPFVIGVLVLCVPASARDNSSPKQTIRQAAAFRISPPLRDLLKRPQPVGYGFHLAESYHVIPARNFGRAVDPVEQNSAAAPANYSLGLNV